MSDHVCPRCGAGHSSRPDPEYEDAAPSAEPHRSFTARQQLAAQGDFAAPAPAAEPTTGEAVKSAISAAKRDFWTVREDGVTLPAAAPSAGPCPRTFDGKHDTGGTVCAYCGKQMAAPSAGAGNATALESRLRRIASGEWTLSGDEGYLVQAANELARLRTESEQLRADQLAKAATIVRLREELREAKARTERVYGYYNVDMAEVKAERDALKAKYEP